MFSSSVQSNGDFVDVDVAKSTRNHHRKRTVQIDFQSDPPAKPTDDLRVMIVFLCQIATADFPRCISSRKSLPLLSSAALNEAYLLRTVLATDRHQTIHPNILTLLSIKYLPSSPLHSSIYLIYDYAHNRDFATHALLYGGTERQFSGEQIQTYLHQLLSAVLFCHDRLVFHCAIELKHLLLIRTGQLKLANFEYAKHAICPTMAIEPTDVRRRRVTSLQRTTEEKERLLV